MSKLTTILNEFFSTEQTTQLLLLARDQQAAKVQAEWLAGCIRPLADELRTEIDRLNEAIPAAQTESDEARTAADSAFVEWESIAGLGQADELELATAKVQAAQTAVGCISNLQAEKRRLIEAETRLARVYKLLQSLAGIEPPWPADVKAIAQEALF